MKKRSPGMKYLGGQWCGSTGAQEAIPFHLGGLLILMWLLPSVAMAEAPATGEAFDRLPKDRAILVKAAAEWLGEDASYLLSRASQYDIVNLTAAQLSENVSYARKVHGALPYLGEKLPESMWRDWVLPYRVLDEDLSLWRRDFYERIRPVVENKTSTKEAADAILEWMWVPNSSGSPRVAFGVAENRLKTSDGVLRIHEGVCGEMCLVYVNLLRAAGIPARHCVASWWYFRNDRHFYCEYWDSQAKEWVPIDSSDNLGIRSRGPRLQTAAGTWNSLAMYAHPAYYSQSDIYGTSAWEKCVRMTEDVGPTYDLLVSSPSEGRIEASVWNSSTWRRISSGETKQGEAKLSFADTKRLDRPVLFTGVKDGALYWALSRPTKDMEMAKLKAAEPGKCITWVAADLP